MRRLLFSMFLLSGLAAAATDAADPYGELTRQNDDYNEALDVPWVEIETQVKDGPKDADLVELELQQLPPGMHLFADLKSLGVDERDHVTRLWLVVRSERGAYNGSYEGFRCSSKEYKVYAYFNPKRSRPLRMVRLPRWRTLRPTGYRAELAKEVLCSDTNPRDPDQIRVRPQHDSSDYVSPYE